MASLVVARKLKEIEIDGEFDYCGPVWIVSSETYDQNVLTSKPLSKYKNIFTSKNCKMSQIIGRAHLTSKTRPNNHNSFKSDLIFNDIVEIPMTIPYDTKSRTSCNFHFYF